MNFGPLLQEPSAEDAEAFRSDAQTGRYGDLESAANPDASPRNVRLVSALALGVIAIPVLIIGNWITRVLLIVMCVAIFIGIVFLRKPPTKSHPASWPEWLRLARFAKANGWGMNIHASTLPYAGRIFHMGLLHTATERIFRNGADFFDAANLEFRTWRLKSTKLNRWHYVAIRLPSPRPQMYLTTTPSTGPFSLQLLYGLTPNQRMLAPATASAPFVAFSPPGFEADPNTVVTSEVLELLVGSSGAYEIEVLGEWMFVFREGAYPCFAPEWWQRMLRVVELAQTRDAAAAS